MQISETVRKEAMTKLQAGVSVPKISKELGISRPTLYNWRRDNKATKTYKRRAKTFTAQTFQPRTTIDTEITFLRDLVVKLLSR